MLRTAPHGKYHVINKILYKWYGKCTNANVCPESLLYQEEATQIVRWLEKEELTDCTASNGWLEKWKHIYRVREKRLTGEADEAFTTTVQAWIERLPKLCQNCKPRSILNLDELGLFFKALSEKGLMEKGKKKKRMQELLRSLLLLMVLLFLNQLLFGYQKDHAVPSPLKIH